MPSEGDGLLHTLDAESHKHDAGVSEDLKYAPGGAAGGGPPMQQTLGAAVNAFELPPLDSKLFDPASKPLLRVVNCRPRRGPWASPVWR